MAFTAVSAYSFMVFNLLCAPCFAAMGAIKREMKNAKWTLATIGYMCGFAYSASLMAYQLGGLLTDTVVFGPLFLYWLSAPCGNPTSPAEAVMATAETAAAATEI